MSKKKYRRDIIVRQNDIPSLPNKGLENRNSGINNSKTLTKIDLIKSINLLSYALFNLPSHQIVSDLLNFVVKDLQKDSRPKFKRFKKIQTLKETVEITDGKKTHRSERLHLQKCRNFYRQKIFCFDSSKNFFHKYNLK